MSYAQTPQFSVGQPFMNGNGCPDGTAHSAVLEDGSTVSILFDQFLVQGKKGGNPWDQMKKYCHFRIPISLPPGYNLEATSINYRGFAHLPNMARAFIMTTGPVANAMGLSVGEQPVRTEIRNLSDGYSITQPLPQNFKGRCRPVQAIEFNSILQLFGPAAKGPLWLMADAQITIDSGDIGGTADPIRIQFRIQPCIH